MKSMLNRTLAIALLMTVPAIVAGKNDEAGFISKNWTKLSNTRVGVKTGQAKDAVKSFYSRDNNSTTKFYTKAGVTAAGLVGASLALNKYLPTWKEASWKGKTALVATSPLWMLQDGVVKSYKWALSKFGSNVPTAPELTEAELAEFNKHAEQARAPKAKLAEKAADACRPAQQVVTELPKEQDVKAVDTKKAPVAPYKARTPRTAKQNRNEDAQFDLMRKGKISFAQFQKATGTGKKFMGKVRGA